MKTLSKTNQIELRQNKIIKISTEEVEIEKDEVIGEINMCKRRIAEAQEKIASETQKLEALENIQKEIK